MPHHNNPNSLHAIKQQKIVNLQKRISKQLSQFQKMRGSRVPSQFCSQQTQLEKLREAPTRLHESWIQRHDKKLRPLAHSQSSDEVIPCIGDDPDACECLSEFTTNTVSPNHDDRQHPLIAEVKSLWQTQTDKRSLAPNNTRATP